MHKKIILMSLFWVLKNIRQQTVHCSWYNFLNYNSSKFLKINLSSILPLSLERCRRISNICTNQEFPTSPSGKGEKFSSPGACRVCCDVTHDWAPPISAPPWWRHPWNSAPVPGHTLNTRSTRHCLIRIVIGLMTAWLISNEEHS